MIKMERYTKPQVPERTKWVSVSYGCPHKNVIKVRVLLSNGKLGYGTYVNRERQWRSFPGGEPLENVKAWMLLPDSFQTPENQQQWNTSNDNCKETFNYKENCNYPHIEETGH